MEYVNHVGLIKGGLELSAFAKPVGIVLMKCVFNAMLKLFGMEMNVNAMVDGMEMD